MSAQFTPRPWRAGIEHNWRPLASEDRDELCTLPHPTFDAVDVFSPPRGESYAEFKANAHLIAAAPELYEALEELRLFLNGHPATPEFLAIMERVVTAMMKARGETA